ncbi:MAG: HFLK protein [Eubacteriales bacterium]
MPDDYGYFGKGQTGYTHYMQAFDRSRGRKSRPPNKEGGCLTTLLLLSLLAVILFLLL